MLKFNTYVYYFGIVLTAVGMLIGLPMLMLPNPEYKEIGKYLTTMITPFGFLLWFTGFTAYTLIRPNVRTGEDDLNEKKKDYQRQIPD